MFIVESRVRRSKNKRYCYRIHCVFFFKAQYFLQVVRMKCARIWQNNSKGDPESQQWAQTQ